jgi:hypothetical protein
LAARRGLIRDGLQREGLAEVGVSPFADGADDGLGSVGNGHHDHTRTGPRLLDAFEEGEAIEFRHVDVGHDEIKGLRLDHSQSGGAIRRAFNLTAGSG